MKEAFLARMKEYLQEEYPQFLLSLERELYRGVRYNPLKLDREQFLSLFPYSLKQTPFCSDTFYITEEVAHLGNHPLHASGAVYIQEPSASSAVEILEVKPDDWVLDLCAAPGGKSTQIAAKLAHSGLLIANEIDYKRSQILLSNMERMGFGEGVITNSPPDQFCKQCAGWFDKVLVDAPCSGEGMMKKHDEAMLGWSVSHVKACADRQLQILNNAFDALKDQGILVYSTCTYAKEENEEVVSRILAQRDDIVQLDCHAAFGRVGLPCEGMDHHKVRRIFPMDEGEGHFIAKFQKTGAGKVAKCKVKKAYRFSGNQQQALAEILEMPKGYYDMIHHQLYFKQTPFIDLGTIHVLRQGILCGSWVKNRFEPHQHLFMSTALKKQFKQICELTDEQWRQFQRGEELAVAGYRGYVALAWHSLIVGFGKGDGSVIKNKYPKGLRKA